MFEDLWHLIGKEWPYLKKKEKLSIFGTSIEWGNRSPNTFATLSLKYLKKNSTKQIMWEYPNNILVGKYFYRKKWVSQLQVLWNLSKLCGYNLTGLKDNVTIIIYMSEPVTKASVVAYSALNQAHNFNFFFNFEQLKINFRGTRMTL